MSGQIVGSGGVQEGWGLRGLTTCLEHISGSCNHWVRTICSAFAPGWSKAGCLSESKAWTGSHVGFLTRDVQAVRAEEERGEAHPPEVPHLVSSSCSLQLWLPLELTAPLGDMRQPLEPCWLGTAGGGACYGPHRGEASDAAGQPPG